MSVAVLGKKHQTRCISIKPSHDVNLLVFIVLLDIIALDKIRNGIGMIDTGMEATPYKVYSKPENDHPHREYPVDAQLFPRLSNPSSAGMSIVTLSPISKR